MAAGTTNSMAAATTTTKLVHRERLAVRLLQNWNALHPEDVPSSGPASAGVMFAGMHPLLSPTTPRGYSQQQQQQQQQPKPPQQLSHINPIVTVGPTMNQLHRPQSLPISRPRTAASGLQIGNKFQRSLSYTAGVGGGLAASPAADTTVDDSLTSLTWLQNLNVLKLSAAAQSATARVSPTGNGLSGTAVGGGGSASGLPSQYGQHHQSTTRPTGAVQPFQHRPPQNSANTSQRLDSVDPNAILDMSPHLMTSSSASMALCRSLSMKQETEMLTSATAGSSPRSSSCHSPPLVTSQVSVGRNGLPNCSPPLPRLSPQTVHGYAHDPTSGLGMSGDLSGSSPSPPALQAQGSCGGSGTKPNHSYATLICMAMNDAVDHRVTLSGIYGWIMENFPYYKSADLSWQNSIRHNLSLNKCFQRVQRDKSDPQGKGNYWTFNPDFQQIVERDMFRNSSGSGKRSASAAGLSSASGPHTGSGGNSAGYGGSRHSSTSNKRHCGNGRRVSADESLPQQKRNSGRRSCAAKSDVIVDENSELEVPLLPEDDDDDNCDVAAAAESTVGRLEDSLDLTAALDMSWSYILGRGIDQPSSPQQPKPQQQQQQQIPDSRHSTVLTSSTSSAGAVIFAGNSAVNGGNISTSISSAILDDVDEEGNFDVLDELIRACAETDEDFRQPLDPRASVDLTIYGVGLRPPEWWPFDDIDGLAEAIGCNVPGLTTSVTCDDVVNRNSSPGVSVATGGDDSATARHRFTSSSSSLVERPHPWAENRERDRFISGILTNGSSNSPQTNNTSRHDVSEGDLLDSSLDGPDQLFLTATSGSRIGSTTYDIDDF